MTDRLNKIYSEIPECEVFADIGCDHGYIAKAMLDNGKCRRVIVSDISEKCLDKALTLLSDYISLNLAIGVVSNGFEKLPACDVALIAGMGGREIISIMKHAKSLPDTLILQPMKNISDVRRFVVESGYKIRLDKMFKSQEKFYELLVISKGADRLTDDEIEFGRTNLSEANADFIEFIRKNIEKLSSYAENPVMGEEQRREMKEKIERLRKCLR
ncbi:MAG: SAM-dependent methyltransferase [Clostridia bacterium]|nr:SAM-dependent methyltransferase [Clostridia bacterium]